MNAKKEINFLINSQPELKGSIHTIIDIGFNGHKYSDYDLLFILNNEVDYRKIYHFLINKTPTKFWDLSFIPKNLFLTDPSICFGNLLQLQHLGYQHQNRIIYGEKIQPPKFESDYIKAFHLIRGIPRLQQFKNNTKSTTLQYTHQRAKNLLSTYLTIYAIQNKISACSKQAILSKYKEDDHFQLPRHSIDIIYNKMRCLKPKETSPIYNIYKNQFNSFLAFLDEFITKETLNLPQYLNKLEKKLKKRALTTQLYELTKMIYPLLNLEKMPQTEWELYLEILPIHANITYGKILRKTHN